MQSASAAPQGKRVVPPTIARQVERLSLFEQYAAARGLHAELRRGASPALVGALVRAYAHLGVMTEAHWSPAHKAYKARALVYAERLVNAGGDRRWGFWHRADARALAGLDASALEDIEAAELVAAGTTFDRPAWVDVLGAWCRFEPERLKELAAQNETAGLAEFLIMLQAEGSGFQTPIYRAVEPVLKRHPDALRALDALVRVNSLGASAEVSRLAPLVFAQALPRAVADITSIPADVRAAAVNAAGETGGEARPPTDLIVMLRSAGAAGVDRQEPSLAALASLADETAYLNALRTLTYLREQLAVDAEKTWERLQSEVAGHPFRAGLATFRSRRSGDSEVLSLYRLLDASELQSTQAAMFTWMYRGSPDHWDEHAPNLETIANSHDDRTFPDLRRAIAREGPGPAAGRELVARLVRVAPHQPATIALLAAKATNEEFLRDSAGWEARYADFPETASVAGATIRIEPLEERLRIKLFLIRNMSTEGLAVGSQLDTEGKSFEFLPAGQEQVDAVVQPFDMAPHLKSLERRPAKPGDARSVLEWVLSVPLRRGGVGEEDQVRVLATSRIVPVKDPLNLPETEFELRDLEVRSSLFLIDDDMKMLEGLAGVRSIDFYGTHLGNGALEHLKELTSLEILSVGNTLTTDAGLAHLEGLSNLKHLRVQQNRIGDSGMASVAKLTGLETLDLYDTLVTDAGLAHLAALKNLKSLNVKMTAVTTDALLEFKKAVPGCRIER